MIYALLVMQMKNPKSLLKRIRVKLKKKKILKYHLLFENLKNKTNKKSIKNTSNFMKW